MAPVFPSFPRTLLLVALATLVACSVPALNVVGKQCGDGCPTPNVCALTPGGGPPTCQSAPSQTLNCAPSPHLCGFPDETNVGVPTGLTLKKVPAELTQGTGWRWDATAGAVRVEGDGGVVDGVEISGGVVVSAPNVTIQNSRILLSGDGAGIFFLPGADHGTVVDSKVDSAGTGRLYTGIGCDFSVTTTTVTRVDISHTANGVSAPGGRVRDSYVHQMQSNADSVYGIISAGGGGLTVEHSTVFVDTPGIGALALFADASPQANDTFDGNLIAGGGYCVYAGSASPGDTSNIRVTNNRWARTLFPTCGSYGWVVHFGNGDPGNVIEGNVWDDTGLPQN